MFFSPSKQQLRFCFDVFKFFGQQFVILVSDVITHIFASRAWFLGNRLMWGCSLGRYDDGLQKEPTVLEVKPTVIAQENPTALKQDEESLERSYSPIGETRRSSVQIRTAPPTPILPSFAKIVHFRALDFIAFYTGTHKLQQTIRSD